MSREQHRSRLPAFLRSRIAFVGLLVLLILATVAVSLEASEDPDSPLVVRRSTPTSAPPPTTQTSQSPTPSPSPSGPLNVYGADGVGQFSPAVAGIPERVYVPNTKDGTVDVIDPTTFKVVRRLMVGGQPHHVTPSWDLHTLYVDNPKEDRLNVIDPRTSAFTRSIAVASPYNLYFTPDGTKAIVVAEYDRLIEFRRRETWKLLKRLPIPWPGVDHMDFSADGGFFLVSCEYSGIVVRVSTSTMSITGTLRVGGRPIDVKLSPDGRVFLVANQGLGGVTIVDAAKLRQIGFIRTGTGAHGFVVSRDARSLYVSNRLAGTISVIRFRTRHLVATWRVGGSPDMLQVSPDGTQLWASNRFGDTVSVISTVTGKVIHSIVVGAGPHGLAYFPQPGRFSLGHNGVYR